MREWRPPFLFFLKRETGRARSKEKTLWRLNLTRLCQVDRGTRVVVIGAVENEGLVPGALEFWGTERALPPHLEMRSGFRGGRRIWHASGPARSASLRAARVVSGAAAEKDIGPCVYHPESKSAVSDAGSPIRVLPMSGAPGRGLSAYMGTSHGPFPLGATQRK